MAVDSAQIAASFDLAKLPPSFLEDPYPYYRALREHAPVKPMPDGSWFLTRYSDILPVYRDPQTWSSDKKKEFGPKFGATPLFEHHTTSLIFNDPPFHTRVRRLILGALSQRHIAAMEPGLVTLVDTLLEAMAQKRQVDLIEDFAAAIPIEVIGNLLDVPRGQRGPLRAWSLAILGALEPVLTGADARKHCRARTPAQPCERPPHASRQIQTRTCGRGSSGASRTESDSPRASAPVHLPAQCRSRDDDQPSRHCAARADQSPLEGLASSRPQRPSVVNSAVGEFLRFRVPFNWAAGRDAGSHIAGVSRHRIRG
jgi:hypothetical protein